MKDRIEEFFNHPPTINQKSFGLINTFYHLVLSVNGDALTSLEPTNTIRDLVDCANKEGFDIVISLKKLGK